MADDPIRTYLDARTALEQATGRTERFVDVIISAGDNLRDWRRVMISNASGVGFPLELANAPSINAKKWPTAQELAEILAAWHKARHACDNAWMNVPVKDRLGLQGPPK